MKRCEPIVVNGGLDQVLTPRRPIRDPRYHDHMTEGHATSQEQDAGTRVSNRDDAISRLLAARFPRSFPAVFFPPNDLLVLHSLSNAFRSTSCYHECKPAQGRTRLHSYCRSWPVSAPGPIYWTKCGVIEARPFQDREPSDRGSCTHSSRNSLSLLLSVAM